MKEKRTAYAPSKDDSKIIIYKVSYLPFLNHFSGKPDASCSPVSTWCEVPFVPFIIFVDVIAISIIFLVLMLCVFCFFGRFLSNYNKFHNFQGKPIREYADVLTDRSNFVGFRE